MISVKLLYYLFLFTCSSFAVYFFFLFIKLNNSFKTGQRFKKNRYKNFSNLITSNINLNQKELNEDLLQSGFKFTSLHYNLLRYSILSIWLLYLLYTKIYTYNFNRLQLIIYILFFFLTSTKKEYKGYKTPFSHIIDFFTYEFKLRKNKEIYRAIIQLKNLSVSKSDINLGSDYIITELMKYTDITKTIFNKMLSLWYDNKKEEACSYFANAVGTKEATELSSILLKLDYLSPCDFREQLKLYLSSVKKDRQTKFLTRNERTSFLLYTFVIVTAFIILFNYLIIGIYIDSMKLYTDLL